MFKKTLLFYTFVVVGIIGVCIFFTLHISDADQKRFKALQQKGQAFAQTSHYPSTKQNRLGVRKDLWITEADGKRLHSRIESASSILTLTDIDDHLDIIEHLNQIHCSMQDRIFEQNGQCFQQIRYFDGASGIYQYSTNRFTAQAASLALFRLSGNDLPSSLSSYTPYLQGIAQDISFALSGKASQFQAKNFKATFTGEQIR